MNIMVTINFKIIMMITIMSMIMLIIGSISHHLVGQVCREVQDEECVTEEVCVCIYNAHT